MKKTLILLAALLIAGATASAQVSFGFGPATRIYYSKTDSRINDGKDVKDVGYTVGVQVSFEDSQRVSDYFGYSAGMDFGTYKKSDYFLKETGLTEMYLDIPVRAKFYIPFSDDFQLFFFAGPSPSVCIGSHVVTGADKNKTSRFGENSNYSRFDVLAGGGIGCEIAERLKIALGYDHGLLNRDKGNITDLHVAAAKLSVSYMF
jgi:hypothetical protein